MIDRSAIPKPIQRLVRQECNFGCVICGMPIFEYDHIVPYAEVLEHKVENLALLCPMHHDAKTKKHLDVDRVKEARESPFNNNKSVITGYKLEPNKKINIKLGSNVTNKTFSDDGDYHCLWVNGISFFEIHYINGWITFSCIVTDTYGKPFLAVEFGELKFSSGIWDYRYEGTRLQIRMAQGEILLDMNLSNYEVEILRGGFIDSRFNDGFIIEPNGTLTGLINGTFRYGSSFGSYNNNSFGGIGILNKTKFPELKKPKGFGSFIGD